MDKPKPKATRTTYEFDTDALRELFARELEVPVERVGLRFQLGESGDERFGPTSTVCTGVEVVVNG